MAAAGGSLESALDRRFQGVTNTMDSIQGLSTWCIDNKKFHSLIVRHWMKWLKKSDSSHRLNLVYLANDVIQNCKRKNAIVYRTAFAEVLSDAFLLLNHEGDSKVIKAVERILSIWEERGVYAGTLITELRGILVKEESPPETPVEQKTPVESKAELRSKIVAEFVPQALIDQLTRYKRTLEEVDLREKQLAAMRVDIFSSDALKKLKDKAGGKKFSKDFEEGSAQLQEFVKFFEKQNKVGPPLLEALSNADIFYEMQYKEVKIVANAYQTFANRVTHLKRKLDSLKSSLPDLDESPIPSPSADAPSPTGSESPFHGLELADPDPDLDGSAMEDDAEPPAPSPLSSLGGSPRPAEVIGENDNREVEDMDLSEEEMSEGGIIVEGKTESIPSPPVSPPSPPRKELPPVTTDQPVTHNKHTAVTTTEESVNMGKIGSILNSLTSVMKNTGPFVKSPPQPSGSFSVKTTPAAPAAASQDTSSLLSILSKVDLSPSDLLSALSKVQGQGGIEDITSLLNSPAPNVHKDSRAGKSRPPSVSSSSAPVAPVVSSQTPAPSVVAPSSVRQNKTSNAASALVQALHRDMDLTADPKPSSSSKSLESKIHSFLQGNPAFNAFDLGFSTHPGLGGGFSPVTGTDTEDGTPVRDEGGGTPTQDEMMDKASAMPYESNMNQSDTNETNSSLQQTNPPPDQNGQSFPSYPYGQPEDAGPGGPYQADGDRGAAPSEHGWFSESQPAGFSLTTETQPSGLFPYQEPLELLPQQGAPSSSPGFFRSSLPPVPQLPPPPSYGLDAPQSSAREALGGRGDGLIGGVLVHDHQHKSLFHPDPPYDLDPHLDDVRYHDDPRDTRPYPDPPYHHPHPEDLYYRPASPPHHYPRLRGRLSPPMSPSEDPYYHRRSPPHPHFAPRRLPPPHHEIRHPGMRPPLRPPPPHPRGPPHPPFLRFHGPDPRLRGKRPGPRGGGPMFPPKRPFLPPRY